MKGKSLYLKHKKNNLPQNYIVPEGLKTFLSSVKSEITDPRNRNTAECNLPREELEALTCRRKEI